MAPQDNMQQPKKEKKHAFTLDQSAHPPNEGDEEEPQDPTRDDASAVTSVATSTVATDRSCVLYWTLRAFVVILLMACAGALCYLAYKVARDQEAQEFEAKFQDYANEIIRSSVNNARNSQLVLESFSRTVTSLSIFANASWPLLTLPHYETRANDYLTISKAESLSFAPVVSTRIREVYENYTVSNQHWIQQGIDYEYLHNRHKYDFLSDDFLTDQGQDSSDMDVVVNAEGFSILNKAKPIQPFIWTHAPLTHRAVPDLSNGPYVATWQTYPAPRNSYVVNHNLLSAPEFEELIRSSKQTFMPTLSDIFDNNFRLFGNAQTIDVDPKSVLLQPIFKHILYQDVPKHLNLIVGYMIAIKKWHQIMTNVLYGGAKPVVVVLRNSGSDACQKAFTYRVVGSKAYFLGRGDLHDTRYDNMETSSVLFPPELISSECEFTLHVYPTLEMEDHYKTNLPVLVLLTVLAFCALLVLGFYLYTDMTKKHQTNRLKSQAQQDQALLRIDHAKQAAAAERQLNEFIAHEVRNPLSAAMSACSFVSSAVQDLALLAAKPPKQSAPAPPPKPQPLFSIVPTATVTNQTQQPAPLFSTTPAPIPLPSQESQEDESHTQQVQEQKDSIMEDLQIIDFSLQFINELLRNMLDVQRAAHHQLKIEKAPTDVLRDILEPVDAMLYRRGQTEVQVILECPQDMMVLTDRLRLKQVVLNLSRNSAKFVEKGYIKFKVVVIQKHVQIWIEDTGPGIPDEKKKKLFTKFQESLDSLSQGTGLGLSLCKILIGLLGGEVYLDETFDSGVPGRPGARFIINLRTPPLELADDGSVEEGGNAEAPVGVGNGTNNNLLSLTTKQRSPSGRMLPAAASDEMALPQNLKVLFVDDDTVLRKLIVRAVRRIAPQWKGQEAASGEAALRIVDELGDDEPFDLIFVDQYMASTEKQLLGTETTQALRSKGIKAKICGLSANDMANDFFAAGADAFVCKPLPAEQNALRQVLCEILFPSSPTEQAPGGYRGKASLVMTPTHDN